MSGTYSDLSGRGSLIAVRMAVEDFGAAAKGMKVDIAGANHKNKPDVGRLGICPHVDAALRDSADRTRLSRRVPVAIAAARLHEKRSAARLLLRPATLQC